MPRKNHTITIEKKHEGKTIYAFPTGNNLSFTKGYNSLVPVKVIKVKRKYAHLIIDSGRADDYCIDRGCTRVAIKAGFSINAGYRWYESVEDYLKDASLDKKIDDIKKFFRTWQWTDNLTVNQLEAVYDALFTEAKNDG